MAGEKYYTKKRILYVEVKVTPAFIAQTGIAWSHEENGQ